MIVITLTIVQDMLLRKTTNDFSYIHSVFIYADFSTLPRFTLIYLWMNCLKKPNEWPRMLPNLNWLVP